jgi:sugar lactone lactonase YvrE
LATFEFRPKDNFDGVPTSIATHDGNLYVGQLSSLEPGKAKVTVFDREGNVLNTFGDLTSVTSIAVASNGDIYATEIFTGAPFNSPGALVKIPADGGPRTTTELPTPGGVAVDHKGNVYVSINSVTPDKGAVIRLST